MIDDIHDDASRRMDGANNNLKAELAKLRTGKASPALVENVRVDYYNNPTPLKQMANISAPEYRLLVVQPWDKTAIKDIEKAIISADLGLNPSSDGNLIRIPIPTLTEERRKDLVKLVHKYGEDSKIAIRNIRRDANDMIKGLEKDKEISEDDSHKALKKIQDLTDDKVKIVDEIVALKEKEVMEV